MERDMSCIHYFLSCKSWQQHDKFTNASFYSNILMRKQTRKRRPTCDTSNNQNKRKHECNVISTDGDSTSTRYLLSCKSWEPDEIFTDIAFYPSTLLWREEAMYRRATSNLEGHKEHETYPIDGHKSNNANSVQSMFRIGGDKLYEYMECDQIFSGEEELSKHLRVQTNTIIHIWNVKQHFYTKVI